MTLKQLINKAIIPIAIVGILVLGFYGCKEKDEKRTESPAYETEKSTEITKTAQEIKTQKNLLEKLMTIEAEEEILHYQGKSSWNKNYFPKILENKNEFESDQIKQFNSKYSQVSITNYNVEFDNSNKSTTLYCNIDGAKKGSWYDFAWFLSPNNLDFHNFERREKELFWEGEIEGVKTTISIKFPYAISKCHQHVWPK